MRTRVRFPPPPPMSLVGSEYLQGRSSPWRNDGGTSTLRTRRGRGGHGALGPRKIAPGCHRDDSADPTHSASVPAHGAPRPAAVAQSVMTRECAPTNEDLASIQSDPVGDRVGGEARLAGADRGSPVRAGGRVRP